MSTVYIDFETRSTADLRKVGVYTYADDLTTEVILVAWAMDDMPVSWAMIDAPETEELKALLADPGVRIVAHNAGFERLMLERVLARRGWPTPGVERFDCTAARAARLALPRSLNGAATVLGLDHQKDKQGHALMMRLCKPRKVLDDGTIIWWDDADRMARLGAYCAMDVEVERELDRILPMFDEDERAIWELTEKINDRGVPVDIGYVTQAMFLAEETAELLDAKMRALTNGLVPNATNVPRLREWLRAYGHDVQSLDKAAITKLLTLHLTERERAALTCRQEAGKSSVKKFVAISDRASSDCRVRGNLVYHGASPGRWAGSGVQFQNFPRNVVKNFDAVEHDVYTLTAEEFGAKYGSTLNTLTGTLRGSIVAPKGKKFVWADYAAVEARGVAWLAGASKLTQRFREDGAIYEEMAAVIYDIPASEVKNPSVHRFAGKTTILGCGYGMAWLKFQMTCAAQGVVLDDETCQRAVSAYRNEHHQIPALWKGLEQAALRAVRDPGTVQSYRAIKFKRTRDSKGDWLKMRLPNGRYLWYCNPRVTDGKYGDVLEYDALNALTKQWGPETTWGGKLTENAVQGICRDLMAGAMLRLEQYGWPCILSVHDEVICEVPDDTRWGRDAMVGLMTIVPAWAEGFPLKAEGKEGYRYGK